MSHTLDLTKIHFSQRHGDIMALGTWLNTSEGWRPCLVLVRVWDERSGHMHPCVVTMDQIWVWDEKVGDPMRAASMLAGFLDPLRLQPVNRDINKVLSIIRWHIGDVVSLPPRPPSEQKAVGIFSVTNKETGRTVEKEITEDV